jgi:hypothetical protein
VIVLIDRWLLFAFLYFWLIRKTREKG